RRKTESRKRRSFENCFLSSPPPQNRKAGTRQEKAAGKTLSPATRRNRCAHRRSAAHTDSPQNTQRQKTALANLRSFAATHTRKAPRRSAHTRRKRLALRSTERFPPAERQTATKAADKK